MRVHLVDLQQSVVDAAKAIGWTEIATHAWMDVQDFEARPGTAFVSPANSLGFMDGGVDYVLSRVMFPGVESTVKKAIADRRETPNMTALGRSYLPIGKALVVPTCREGVRLVCAPTMWLPQDVCKTHNAYHAMYAALRAASASEKTITDLVCTGMCTGCGMMSPDVAVAQMKAAHDDFLAGRPPRWTDQEIMAEQPKYYQNTEFKYVPADEIVRAA